MQVRTKMSGAACDFIFRIATPLSVASPDLTIANGKKSNSKVVIVEINDYLNGYLIGLSLKFGCSKGVTLAAIVEIFAQSGLKIDEVLQVTYLAKKFSLPNSLKLTQSAVCAALLEYLSKLNLSGSEWQIFNDTANELRGIKRKYTKK